LSHPTTTPNYTLSLHDALPIYEKKTRLPPQMALQLHQNSDLGSIWLSAFFVRNSKTRQSPTFKRTACKGIITIDRCEYYCIQHCAAVVECISPYHVHSDQPCVISAACCITF